MLTHTTPYTQHPTHKCKYVSARVRDSTVLVTTRRCFFVCPPEDHCSSKAHIAVVSDYDVVVVRAMKRLWAFSCLRSCFASFLRRDLDSGSPEPSCVGTPCIPLRTELWTVDTKSE